MAQYAICVSTNRSNPPASTSAQQTSTTTSPSGATGTIQYLCPYTGTNLIPSSFTSPLTKLQEGVVSLSADEEGVLVYAGSLSDRHAHYFFTSSSTQSSSSPTTTSWKCRVPEQLSGIISTSDLIAGAGNSGKIHVWDSAGNYHTVFQAHYRSISTLRFSDCGGYLWSGGVDGIVNCWNVVSVLMNQEDGGSGVHPVQSWSEHQLGVSDLVLLGGGQGSGMRAASCGLDRLVVIMELCSGATLARIILPSSLRTITTDDLSHNLYAGASNGTIYCMDLDVYAIAKTAESASLLSSSHPQFGKRKRGGGLSTSGSRLEESIFGMGGAGAGKSTTEEGDAISELCGHERSVLSISVLNKNNEGGDVDNNTSMIVSGGADGTVRIWDLDARCCIRVLYPWGGGGVSDVGETSSLNRGCPCSTITIVGRECVPGYYSSNSGIGGGGLSLSSDKNYGTSNRNSNKNRDGGATLAIRPLQRFLKRVVDEQQQQQQQGSVWNSTTRQYNTSVPPGSVQINVLPTRHREQSDWKRVVLSGTKRYCINDYIGTTLIEDNSKLVAGVKDLEDKAVHPANNEEGGCTAVDGNRDVTIEQLQKKLNEANETIQRWESVNNKLVQKLKKSKTVSTSIPSTS